MDYFCPLCSKSISIQDIARNRFGSSIVQINCSDCGFYHLVSTAETIVKNLKVANELKNRDLEVIRNWVKENPKEIITQEVLFNLLPENIKSCEQKFNIKMAQNNNEL